MISMPWRTHCLTDSHERACAATRLPRICASRTATATSSSLIQVVSAAAPGTKLSPERLSLIESTPYLRNMRTHLAHLLGAADDDAEAELLQRQVRQRLVAEAAGDRDLLARREVARPGIRPSLIALRVTTSSRGLAHAAPTHDVKPASR